jgi:hypothetical protein
MDLNKIDRINIEMKDGTEWIGVKTIKDVTYASDRLLSFEHSVVEHSVSGMVVVNWSDVKIAYFYEGED